MSLTCKNCGGNINFDIETNMMTCESCGSSQSLNSVSGVNESIYENDGEANARINTYRRALNMMATATEINSFQTAQLMFERIRGTLNADALAKECEEKIQILKTEQQYQKALLDMQSQDVDTIISAQSIFEALQNYKDALLKKEECNELIRKARDLQEAKEIEERKKAQKRRKKRRLIGLALVITIIISSIFYNFIYSASRYDISVTPIEQGYLTERGNSFEFCYDVEIENNGFLDITALECAVIIEKGDDVIVDTAISFSNYSSAIARAGKSARFKWELTTDSNYVAEELYYHFNDLDVRIEVTKIRFKNGKIKTY